MGKCAYCGNNIDKDVARKIEADGDTWYLCDECDYWGRS